MKKCCKRTVRPLLNPVALALAGATVLAPEVLDGLRLRELSAIESFHTGAATVHDWRALADVANVAETMARWGVGPEVAAVAACMHGHLEEAHARHAQTGCVALTTAGLRAARELYAFHDLQRTSVGRAEYERALRKTANRIRSAHPDAKVLMGEKEPEKEQAT